MSSDLETLFHDASNDGLAALGEDSRSQTSCSEATAFLLNGFLMPKKPLVTLSIRGVSVNGLPKEPNLSWISSKLDVMAAADVRTLRVK